MNDFPGSNGGAELQHLWEEPHCCPPAFAADRFCWLLTLEISKVLCLMNAEIWVASFLLLAWSVALSSGFCPREVFPSWCLSVASASHTCLVCKLLLQRQSGVGCKGPLVTFFFFFLTTSHHLEVFLSIDL